MKILQVSPNIYSQQNTSKNQNNFKAQPYLNDSVSFSGATPKSNLFDFITKPYQKIMEPIEKSIADGLGWLIQTKAAKKIVEKTEDYDIIKNNLTSHLIVLGSTIMSGFYIVKTLKNDKMEEEHKKTLAINQAAVFSLSTIMAYTFDGMMTKKTKKLVEHFKKINTKINATQMDNYIKGIDIAKKVMIFSTMYRFIAPVIVTPFSNYIGNKLNERKKAELAFGNKDLKAKNN